MIPLELVLGIVFVFFLCWGSFLNVVAYRVAYDERFLTKRSYCPSCRTMIAWYDNIPLFSWLMLRGHCRSCNNPISAIYPALELSTAIIMTCYTYQLIMPLLIANHLPISGTLIRKNIGLCGHWLTMALFFSALLVNTATDLYQMHIAQLFTVWLIPELWFCAWAGFLPISLTASILGAVFGYGILWLVATLFKLVQGKQGMGEGDFELMALIGAVVGIVGVWYTLLIASASGSVVGLLYLYLAKKDRTTPIPFGPFLAFGAIMYLLTMQISFW